MILIGQYDSPFVRRVAVSLRVLGLSYEHDTRSVFADFDAMRQINPLGRIPSLLLDDGEVLIDSAAILDWLDRTVGPERALTPVAGAEPAGGLEALAAEQWPESARLDQGAITAACMLRYLRIAVPELLPTGRYPSLDALSARCEARPEFSATCPADYAVPSPGG